jgi:hypothetical protein
LVILYEVYHDARSLEHKKVVHQDKVFCIVFCPQIVFMMLFGQTNQPQGTIFGRGEDNEEVKLFSVGAATRNK